MRRPALGFAILGPFALAFVAARDGLGQPSTTPAPPSLETPAPAACPAGMLLVPGATVTLGEAGNVDALPPGPRTIAAFCIDRTEVTVARYQACVARGRCPVPEKTVSFPGYGPPEPMRAQLSRFCNAWVPERAQHPMNCIDETSADAFCRAEGGGALPDEEQWEYAARGPHGERFPWGASSPSAGSSVLCWDRRATGEGTCAIGRFPEGASPFGLLDMAGNVWEWTSSRTSEGSVVRGGGWTNFLARFVSATYRWPLLPTTRLNCIGFRCVRPPGRTESQ
jgi:formylglycine-generating enzyme required for sulfatase activity